MQLDEREAFSRLVLALRPYLDRLVIVGGWGHRLFALHELARPVNFAPLMTEDADVAMPLTLPPRPHGLKPRLAEAGFHEELLGEHRPPVTHYRLGGESGFYAEFITPLLGSTHRRDATPDATKVIAGVNAQKLRYVDILLGHPWSVRITKSAGYAVGSRGLGVLIPNAVSYLAQKLLVLSTRRKDKQGKDLLYVHDTLLTFGASLAELSKAWRNTVRPDLHPNRVRQVMKLSAVLFQETTDAIRDAAVIARSVGRPLRADDVLVTCQHGLAKVFAPSRA